MSHTIELSDEQYAALEAYAQRQGRSPDELIRAWVASVAEQPPSQWEDESPPTEEELRAHPILRLAGLFAFGEPGWADRHDEVSGQEDVDDPLAPFIGAYDFEDDPGWIERHDEYFAGIGGADADEE